MSCSSLLRCLLVLMASPWVVGCALTPPVAQNLPPLTWPAEANVPARVQFIKAFSTPDDLGFAKSFFQRVADVIFGASDVRLVRPMAVIAVKDVVYVADPGAKCVQRFDTTTGRHDLIYREGNTGLPSPVALAKGNLGEVYLTDSELAQVFVIKPGASVATPVKLPPMLQPTGVAMDASTGRLIVVDTASHVVNIFNPDGSLHTQFGKRGTGPGEFNYPTLIWHDSGGKLYVTDSLNFRVQVFDSQGGYLSQFGRLGDSSGDNMRQKGVATDSYGHVYIVDALFNAVQIFNDQGHLLMSFGAMGSDRGEFWLPSGIFIGNDDLIYVADSHNRRIQVFRYIGGPT